MTVLYLISELLHLYWCHDKVKACRFVVRVTVKWAFTGRSQFTLPAASVRLLSPPICFLIVQVRFHQCELKLRIKTQLQPRCCVPLPSRRVAIYIHVNLTQGMKCREAEVIISSEEHAWCFREEAWKTSRCATTIASMCSRGRPASQYSSF